MEITTLDTVGSRIRNARKNKGLTQSALAEVIGVQRQAIIKWERNEARPSRENVDRLSCALGLPKSAFNPYGAGGISATSGQYSGHIPHIEWHQVPAIAHKDTDVETQLVTVHVGPSNEVRDDEIRMIIKDDSMSPEFNPGDIIRFSTRKTPKNGRNVIAAIDGETEGVLRKFRDRGDGYFELWAVNPSYPTIHSDRATIAGVVTRHVRMLEDD